MRKILLLLTLVGLSTILFAQFSPSDLALSYMSDADKQKFESSEKFFNSAKSLISKAEKIDKKYEKYDNAKKRKKWEKKTKEAKMLRTQAQAEKGKGYAVMVSVLKSLVEAGTFHFEQDQAMATEYVTAADSESKKAGRYIAKYNGLKKSKFKKILYKSIRGDIEKNERSYKTALNGLEEALVILSEQEEKKRLEDSDKMAWSTAQSANTLEAYNKYLSAHPSGMYSAEAQEKIAEMEQAFADAAREKAENAITYKVQILADKNAWTKEKISTLYPTVDTEQIEEWFDDEDEYFKYSTGKFESYRAAVSLRDQLKNSRNDVFIIAYKRGYKIDITEARTATNELEDE